MIVVALSAATYALSAGLVVAGYNWRQWTIGGIGMLISLAGAFYGT